MTDNSLDLRAVQFSGLASRIRRLDASMLLWLVLIAVLAFLILNPVLRLIISSLQETDTGRFTLANYRTAYGNIRHLQSLLNSLELGVGVALLATCFARSDRLGDFPHRYAGQGIRPADGVRRLRDAALSRRHRLDPAGGTEFRLAQQGLDGADRRRRTASSISIR